MINFKCEFDSKILNTRVPVEVYLPYEVDRMTEEKNYRNVFSFSPFPTVYFLHGAWDNGSQWIENTGILRLCQQAGFAAVIPSVGNSFYANGRDGLQWEDFFFEELLGFVRAIFPLSDKKEDNFACGVSMGGYGVFKAVFKHPEVFSRCACLSPVVDIAWATRLVRKIGMNTDYTLGNWKELKGSEYDLVKILSDAQENSDQFAKILTIIGTGDYMMEANRSFHQILEEMKIPHKYIEYEGKHDWQFWDEHMKECIDFLAAKD